MIASDLFLDAASAQGLNIAASVPCSFLAPLLTALDADKRFPHISATSEAEAVGIAAGAWLAGKEPLLLMQNSGFCDALNPISSLLCPFEIPLLFLVSGRGAFGITDEPQHDVVGSSFQSFAETIGMPFVTLTCQGLGPESQLADIRSSMERLKMPGVLAIPKGTFSGSVRKADGRNGEINLRRSIKPHSDRPREGIPRKELLRQLRQYIPDEAVIVTTTGYTGRELCAAYDHPRNLYLVGSMGCASAVGLGISLFGDAPVVVIDGDGAALMRMGNLATIGALSPSRFLHLVLNNGGYESTGGQKSVAGSVDFAAVAAACGYKTAHYEPDLHNVLDLIRAVSDGSVESPALIEVLTLQSGETPAGRQSISPREQSGRFRKSLM